MRSFLQVLSSLALVALCSAAFGSREFKFDYGPPHYGQGSQESSEESKESSEENRHPAYYTKDIIHGMGPQHSFLTVDFPKLPKHNIPDPYRPNFQAHFGGPAPAPAHPRQSKEDQSPYHGNYAPRYENSHEQFQKPYAPKGHDAEVRVVNTDGKKIMTMIKPGYKMVVEEIEKPGDHSKMIGRTVKETQSTKDKGDNGETMHQSQSYQYQVVQSESSDDKQPAYVRSSPNAKGVNFAQFSQPPKNNYPAEFPAQFGYQQHQDFVKAHQPKNPFNFQVPKAFEGLRIPPVHNVSVSTKGETG